MDQLNLLLELAQNAFFLTLGIFGIGFLIGFHELGHFLMCKLFNIRTPSFSIGMGPVIFSKQIGETNFVLSAIPIGGYVEIAGSAEPGQGEQADAQAEDEHSFAAKPYWQKLLVMLGGILFNFLFAYAAFTGLFLTGMPKTPMAYPINAVPVVGAVFENSPAQQAGIQTGDKLISLNEHAVNNNVQEILAAIKPLANTPATLTIERDGVQQKMDLTIGARGTSNDGYLGIMFDFASMTPQTFGDAIRLGIESTHLWVKRTIGAFTHMFANGDVSNVGGPIMIISQTMKGAQKGLKIFLALLALISVNLAVLNLIPLPVLDGGQIMLTTLEAIFRRRIPDKVKEYIFIGTWIFFVMLLLYLSLGDISRLGLFGWIAKLFGKFGRK